MVSFEKGILPGVFGSSAEKITASGIGARFASVSSAPRHVWDRTLDVGSAPEVSGMG
jgi:hypothetical protein